MALETQEVSTERERIRAIEATLSYLATKADVALLKADVERLRADMIKWQVGLAVAVVGAVFAIVRFAG